MEEKIIYVSQETIHSNKKAQDYFIVYYILNKKPVSAFVPKEVYDKIALKKLKELGEYIAVFKTTVVGSNIQATLFDIK